jgi:AGCS family alanine or glycine:cation symporter
MDAFWNIINAANGYLFSDFVVYALLFTGVAFTIWSGFGQYWALTHGVSVVRGKFDKKDDPGAISHFQALSTALSATVGLGNIAGVAVAVAIGGPGAVLWMWIIGLLGMSLKMTEVTQSMLYRDTSDPEEPHGGPMFVVREGLRKRFMPLLVKLSPVQGQELVGEEKTFDVKIGLGPVGSFIGSIFVITLIISAITGGNMFQAWNVAEVTKTYFQVPTIATGIILCVVVGAVIIGGIKRIGKAASVIVPVMCVIYLLAALYVLGINAGQIPEMFSLIFRHGLPEFMGGVPAGASGAFVGASVGSALMWGVKRALFSSEAGQGSAPIAHAAAKSDEPVREGVVAGLEPFIDTIVVCTLTALVILSTGAWDRAPEASVAASDMVVEMAHAPGGEAIEGSLTYADTKVSDRTDEAKRVTQKSSAAGWDEGEKIFALIELTSGDVAAEPTRARLEGKIMMAPKSEGDGAGEPSSATQWIIDWDDKGVEVPEGQLAIALSSAESADRVGVYGNYAGASLTAHAFDRAAPGLGKWLISLAAWLFAISTMISWSYYGEQGVIYLVGERFVLPYKVIYCLLIVVSCLGFIETDAELDSVTTLGLGVMLVANIPIMWLFARESMAAYHDYIKRLKSGEFDSTGS